MTTPQPSFKAHNGTLLPDVFFTISDQHVVIKLRVTEVNVHGDDFTIIRTAFDGEPDSHAGYFHDEYLKKIYLHKDSRYSATLFTTLQEAEQAAATAIADEIQSVQATLDRLKTKLLTLTGTAPQPPAKPVHHTIPQEDGLYWYCVPGKKPEPVCIQVARFGPGKFKCFDGGTQDWLRENEYLMGPCLPL